MEIDISKLSPQDIKDFADLLRVFEIVFEMSDFKMPGDKHLQLLLEKPDFLTLVAKYDNKVVGGLTVYILHGYFSIKPSAYIYDVGILPGYQRKGIGKKLIIYLIKFCRENNFEEAFVQAETEDIRAVDFYRQTAFSSELQATHFSYSIKKIELDNGK